MLDYKIKLLLNDQRKKESKAKCYSGESFTRSANMTVDYFRIVERRGKLEQELADVDKLIKVIKGW